MTRTGGRARLGTGHGASRVASGFTLVELLTVVFIISLLVAILMPSLTAARNAAKKTSTSGTLRAISTGLEAFRNDHEGQFRQTNGYPPSFAHPPIADYAFRPWAGHFPFLPGAQQVGTPVVYGAHWLPAMLIGVDALGFVSNGDVPPSLKDKPYRWYSEDATGDEPLSRSTLYLETSGLKLVKTEDLPGFRQETASPLFPNWEQMKMLPVISDAFDQPILYYVARTYGSARNFVEAERNAEGAYEGGKPYYFHQDNEGFTGSDRARVGWNFGGGPHAIWQSGDDMDATNIDEGGTFAAFIHDGKAHAAREAHGNVTAETPLQPLNRDSFLLISAGRDGRYGTLDDVTNFPLDSD